MPLIFEAVKRWPESEIQASSIASSIDSGGTARQAPLRALLVKSAEAAFRGGGPGERTGQDALSAGLLAHADVLLQDTQSSIRWALVKRWLGSPNDSRDDSRPSNNRSAASTRDVLPLGVYIGADEALDTLAAPGRPSDPLPAGAASRAELWAEHEALRRIFSQHARSLRGLRFGYCHGTLGLDAQLLAQRVPVTEPPATGELNPDERGAYYYCGALLAWRAGALHAEIEYLGAEGEAGTRSITGRAWAAAQGLWSSWTQRGRAR